MELFDQAVASGNSEEFNYEVPLDNPYASTVKIPHEKDVPIHDYLPGNLVLLFCCCPLGLAIPFCCLPTFLSLVGAMFGLVSRIGLATDEVAVARRSARIARLFFWFSFGATAFVAAYSLGIFDLLF